MGQLPVHSVDILVGQGFDIAAKLLLERVGRLHAVIDMRLGSSEWGSNEPCIGQWSCVVAVAGRVEQLVAQGQLEQADEQGELVERRRRRR